MNRVARTAALSALLLAGCRPTPLPEDPQTLFMLPAHSERLRNSGDIAALAGLVANALDRHGPANDCDPQNMAPHGRDCRALFESLVTDGPAPWAGELLDAGHVEEIARKLRWAGWNCPSPRGADDAGDPFRVADGLAWLDCDGGEWLDATVSTGVGVADAATARLRMEFRGHTTEVELLPWSMADEPDDSELIVRAIDGRVHRIQLDYRPSSPAFELSGRIGALDPPSILRVLQVAQRQRDRFIETLREGDPLPELQIAERASAYLTRLPDYMLHDGLEQLRADGDPLRRATVMFARCQRDSADASRACLMGTLVGEPEVIAWLPTALEQAERRAGVLPDEHPVSRHFAVLREALAFARGP